jgi:hypothetical protein
MISGYNDHTLNYRDMQVSHPPTFQKKKENQLQSVQASPLITQHKGFFFLKKTKQHLH